MNDNVFIKTSEFRSLNLQVIKRSLVMLCMALFVNTTSIHAQDYIDYYIVPLVQDAFRDNGFDSGVAAPNQSMTDYLSIYDPSIVTNYVGTTVPPWDENVAQAALKFRLPQKKAILSTAKLYLRVMDILGSPTATVTLTDDNNWIQTTDEATSKFPTLSNPSVLLTNAPVTATGWFYLPLATSALATKIASSGTTDVTLIITGSAAASTYFNFVADDDASGNKAYLRLTFKPQVQSVSVPANNIYRIGDVIAFVVSFEQLVNVTGRPQLPITLNTGGTVQASYVSGSGTQNLVFRYTVASGDLDMDGVTVGNVIELNGGTIRSDNDDDAELNLYSVGATAGVRVDGTLPTISSVSPPGNATYIAGQNLDYTVNFSEAVNVIKTSGTPYLTLTIGSTTAHATYISGTGTTAIVFRYTIVSGDYDVDGIALASNITLNGGTIYDVAGNSATLSFTGSTAAGVQIGTPPTVTTVAPSDIFSSTATLKGTVNANNASTTVTFEYGLDTNYGTTVTAVESPVTGSSATSVSKAITGLASGTTYHYRVKAVNAGGTTYGTDQTFTTVTTAPTFTSTPTLTVPYGKPYNYAIGTTREGTLATTVTAVTKPAWLSFAAEQNQATLFGSTPGPISAVAGDDEGNVYAITPDGGTIYKIVADGTATQWKTDLITGDVYDLHIANGYIYIPREGDRNSSITRIPLSAPSDPEEIFASIAGGVHSLTDKDGYIYAANRSHHEVWRIPENNGNPELILNSSNLLGNPWGGLTFGNDGDLYIANATSVQRFDGTNLSSGNAQTPTTVLSSLPSYLTSIRQDKNGYFYVAIGFDGVRKYTSDFSSYQSVLYSAYSVESLSLTDSGALVYAGFASSQVYRLQTVGALSGTPAKTDVGSHEVVVRASNSVGSTEQRFTIEVVDNVPPVITAQTPANNASNVALKPTLSLTFDEAVNLGTTGTLTVYNGTTPLKSFDLSVPEDKAQLQLSVDRLSLSVALPENLPVNTAVTVGISAGFVKDDHNNSFAGFTADSNTWKFTTINKNEQTITFPVIDAKTYGDATFTLGDEKTNRDLTVTYTATDPSVVSINGNQATILKAGTTTITASQAGDEQNFAATPVERTLIVDKAALTVTADNKSKVYGEANPALTFQYSGWKNSDNETVLDTKPTASTTISASTPAGTYEHAITASGGNDKNYDFTYISASFSVKKGTLVIWLDQKTKNYGDENPTLTYRYTGFMNGDDESDLDYIPYPSTSVTRYTNAGTYTSSIGMAGGLDDNYYMVNVPANFIVNKAPLTVKADDKTKAYGETNPELTVQYSGFMNGDDETVLDTRPTAFTTVDNATSVGNYEITVAGGIDNNYAISTYAPGEMEVTKAALIVTADNKTKVYGDTNPELTFQYSGFMNGDDETVLDTKPTALTTVDNTTGAGIYEITVSGGIDNNYSFRYFAGLFEVTVPKIAGDTNGNGKIDGNEVTGDVNGSGIIDGNEIYGDSNGNGKIDGTETTTGIDHQENIGKLSAWAVRNTEIRLTGQVSKVAIATLYDIQGKVILVANLSEGDLNIIQTPSIRTGVYLLFVKDNKRMESFKILVRE